MTRTKRNASGARTFMRSLAVQHSALIVLCLIMLGVLTGFVVYIVRLDEQNQQSHQQERVLASAGDLRTRIEQEINTTLNLTLGSLVYVAANPDITQTEFERYAREIILRAPYVLNLGLARDNVISHIYPVRGNEKALGLRYLEHPQQRVAVLRAIEARNTVIAGPLTLVQGGEGLISRIPVYLDNDEHTYWGIASIVVLLEPFLHRIGIGDYEKQLHIAIRGKDALGAEGEVFYGDGALFAEPSSVLLTIPLPVGSWVMAAEPAGGWHLDTRRTMLIYGIGLGLAVVISGLVYFLLWTVLLLKREKQNVGMAIEHKNRFFSYMAHELRTPLTAIQGAVKILNSGIITPGTEQWHGLLQNANRNCERLQWIVNDILDLRKLESGKIEYSMRGEALQDIAGEAIDEVREYASQFQVPLVFSDQARTPVRVDVDRMRVQQVIVNLLSNAIKYSPEQQPVIVTVAVKDGLARLEVRDHGKGIADDRLDRIFREFSQAGSASSESRKAVASTGLGLTISKRIIDDHGGRIGCYNHSGGGAVFYFEIPVSQV